MINKDINETFCRVAADVSFLICNASKEASVAGSVGKYAISEG